MKAVVLRILRTVINPKFSIISLFSVQKESFLPFFLLVGSACSPPRQSGAQSLSLKYKLGVNNPKPVPKKAAF